MKKNNKFIKKYKIFIIIGTLFVVWACFLFFIINPSIKSLKSNFDFVQMRLMDMKIGDEKLSKISLLRNNFSKVDSERDNLNVIFSKDDIVSLVKELEIIAQGTGNTVSISVDENVQGLIEADKEKINTKENDLIKSLPTKNYFMIKISLEGDYSSLIRFIDKLNNTKYYNSVVSFNIVSEKITMDDISDKNSNNLANGISIMGSGGESNITSTKVEKLVLNSNLDVLFYLLENNDGK